MELVTCPHCRTSVFATAEGDCPGCRKPLASRTAPAKLDNPFASPAVENDAGRNVRDGFTLGEKLYTAGVILCAGLMLISLASFHFVIIPQMEEPGVFYFLVASMWLVFLTLAITTLLNLSYRKLLVIPTVLQCFVLCIMVYFLPFSVWGAVLLFRRLRRAKTASG